jgi:hypothetical protein
MSRQKSGVVDSGRLPEPTADRDEFVAERLPSRVTNWRLGRTAGAA